MRKNIKNDAAGVALQVSADGGRIVVVGDLTYDTVSALPGRFARLLQSVPDAVTVDLGSVGRFDSAGLAVLVEWTGAAQSQRRSLHYVAVPARIRTMARVSGLEPLLFGVEENASAEATD